MEETETRYVTITIHFEEDLAGQTQKNRSALLVEILDAVEAQGDRIKLTGLDFEMSNDE
jgi:hypothetical protein